MATTYYKYVTASVQNLLTTELNSLANAGTAVSTTEVNNTSYRWPEAQIEVYIAAEGIGPYLKAMVDNVSGGALASSGNTVTLLGINYTDS